MRSRGIEVRCERRREFLARRGPVGCAGFGAGDRAGRGYGRGADVRLDEPRIAGADRRDRQRRVLVAFARQRLWRKGEESGHTQKVLELRVDCDKDVVLMKIEQVGGIACHTGRRSCFFNRLDGLQWQDVEPVLKNPKEIYK
jgi:hypothetical protein